MSSGTQHGDPSPDKRGAARAAQRPGWADGLRQLYDSVVDEPLPDTFKELLDRLDEGGAGATGHDEASGNDGAPGGHR